MTRSTCLSRTGTKFPLLLWGVADDASGNVGSKRRTNKSGREQFRAAAFHLIDVATSELTARLEASHQQQNNQDYEHKAETTRRVITPAGAIGPSRKRAQQ
jgi:hypothetical protein